MANGNGHTDINPDHGCERVFDIYMKRCFQNEIKEPFISDLIRDLGTKLDMQVQLKNTEKKKKTLYEFQDSGEIIIDIEKNSDKDDIDLCISSYKKDMQNILSKVLDYFSPEGGRLIYYENSDNIIGIPKEITSISDKYNLRCQGAISSNKCEIEFTRKEEKREETKEEKIEGLEEKISG